MLLQQTPNRLNLSQSSGKFTEQVYPRRLRQKLMHTTPEQRVSQRAASSRVAPEGAWRNTRLNAAAADQKVDQFQTGPASSEFMQVRGLHFEMSGLLLPPSEPRTRRTSEQHDPAHLLLVALQRLWHCTPAIFAGLLVQALMNERRNAWIS